VVTGDRVAFLRARLAEDEQVARAVEDNSAPWEGEWVNDDNRAIRTYNGWVLTFQRPPNTFCPGFGDHVARFDPARALAEVAAKRRILDEWECAARRQRETAELHAIYFGRDRAKANELQATGRFLEGAERALALAVAALTVPYAQHPDFREEWTP
jgi:hypothetical protein